MIKLGLKCLKYPILNLHVFFCFYKGSKGLYNIFPLTQKINPEQNNNTAVFFYG